MAAPSSRPLRPSGGSRSAWRARAQAIGLRDLWFGDTAIYAEFYQYESNPERFRAAFDVLTWAAKIVLDRRARNPPPWQLAISAEWPSLAQGWSLRLDVRRGAMQGTVRGRPTSARVIVKKGAVMTQVEVAAAFPQGCSMSLTPQKDGFFSSLFRGQDIIIGDAAFDAAFVIKGEPEPFVRYAAAEALCPPQALPSQVPYR